MQDFEGTVSIITEPVVDDAATEERRYAELLRAERDDQASLARGFDRLLAVEPQQLFDLQLDR